MSNELILSKDEQLNLWDFCVKLSKSKMVPAMYQSKAEDVFASTLMGRELGFSPMMSLYAFVVIQGSVTMKVFTMNAIVRAKCPDALIEIKIDHGKKEARVVAKRNKDDLGYESLWNMDMAKTMGLSGKSNWISQPLNMLKARALSDALRTVFPDVLMGLYSTEEMEDLPPIVAEEKRLTMSQQLQKELDEDFPIPEHEKKVGPLYRVTRGTTMGGKQLKDFPLEEIEAYLEKLIHAKKKLPWQTDLCHVLTEYISNYELYREQLLELGEVHGK